MSSFETIRMLIIVTCCHAASQRVDGSNITITVDNYLMAFYIGGQQVDASQTPNGNVWERADTVPLPTDASLVAVWARDVGVVAGILASSSGDLFITSNTSWKCIPKNEPTDDRWMQEDYDDSRWPSATAVGGNPSHWHGAMSAISSTAMWIWTDRYLWRGNTKVDLDVLCRGRPVKKLPRPTVIGVAVGVAVGVVLLLAAVIIVLAVLCPRWHRRHSNDMPPQKSTPNIYQQLSFATSADNGSASRDNEASRPSTYERIHRTSVRQDNDYENVTTVCT